MGFTEVIFKLRPEEVGFDQSDRITPKGPDVGMRVVCQKKEKSSGPFWCLVYTCLCPSWV